MDSLAEMPREDTSAMLRVMFEALNKAVAERDRYAQQLDDAVGKVCRAVSILALSPKCPDIQFSYNHGPLQSYS